MFVLKYVIISEAVVCGRVELACIILKDVLFPYQETV